MVIDKSRADPFNSHANLLKTAEKEVQDDSCLGFGGIPQLQISTKIGGYWGLIESISAVSNNDSDSPQSHPEKKANLCLLLCPGAYHFHDDLLTTLSYYEHIPGG